MYCPNCKTHYDKGRFCEECGTKLIADPETKGAGLNIGDANAISGGVHTSDSHNVSHDDHSVTTNTTTITNVTHERARTEVEIIQEKKVRYLNECRRMYADNVLEQHELAELETLRVELGLDKSTADAILNSVRNMVTKSASKKFDTLPPIAKIKIDKFTKSVRENDVASLMKQIDGIESLSEKFPQVDLLYKYYLVLAALKPEKCVERFENRRFDSYWCSFWTYIAYLKIGRNAEAEDVLFDIPAKYSNFPEDNVNLLATAGAVMRGEKEDAWDFLNMVMGEYTPLLRRFADTLYLVVDPVTAAEMGVTEDSCAFYLQNMFNAGSEEAMQELVKSAVALCEAEKYDEAYDLLSELEKKGCADSRFQFQLGRCYDNGYGVAEDKKKAVEWFTKAAEQGYARAQCNLGFCYDNGNGVAEDYKKAVEWYTKAAEQGYARAQNNLGVCYLNGVGVARDMKKAVEWYTKAAEQGYACAQCNLGYCYDNGNGVAKDKKKAVEWYTKAAEQGSEDAKDELRKINQSNFISHWLRI